MLDEVLTGDALLPCVRLLRQDVGALEELDVGLRVVALDGPDEELERLPLGGLARSKAREEAPLAFGPDLFAALQLSTSSWTQCSRGPADPGKRPPGAGVST
jgi:hypothetical protein